MQALHAPKRTFRGRARRGFAPRAAAAEAEALGTAVRQLQAARELADGAPGAPISLPVPGTELLPTPPPETLPPPSQGMDFVLDQLSTKPPPPQAAKAPAAALGGALDGAADSLSGASKTLADGAGAAASQASAAAAEAAAAVGGAVGEGVSTAASAASAAAAELAGQVGGLSSTAGALYESAQQEAGAVVGTIQDGVSSLVGGAQAAAGGAASGVAAQAQAQLSAALDQLPPGVRDALTAAGAAGARAAGAATHAVASDPALAGAAAAAAVGVPAVLAWRAAYGGFAGTLSPDQALAMLQGQDALLVDVRPEAKRLESGVPLLKRGARGKGVALPPVQLLPSLARRVRGPDALALQILGAQVAALARAAPGTRLVVMDDAGERGKAVARAAAAAGVRRAYVLDGGFRGWQAAGLAVAARASEYGSSPLAAVGDAAESAAEEAAGLLRSPVNAALALAGAALAGAVLLNYHAVLRLAGVVGVEATLAARLLSYSSPQDAADDLNAARAWVVNAASVPLALVQGAAGLVQQQRRRQQGKGAEQGAPDAAEQPAAEN
jgi:rhodanese-related sulfurtransferase